MSLDRERMSFYGSEEEGLGKGRMGSVVRALVDYNKDPKRIGRVRVRIPFLHGADDTVVNYIEPEELPWAYPCTSGPAGEDYGTFLVPQVGSYVWVLCENGDDSNLVYLGGVYGEGQRSPRLMNDIVEDGSSDMGQYTSTPDKHEVPEDVFEGKGDGDDYPHRGVIFKSPKGHTIVYDDTDGQESFSIIDRGGQMIRFDCPVSQADNVENASRRGTKSARTGTQLPTGGKITVSTGNSYVQVSESEGTLKVGSSKVTLSESGVSISAPVINLN